MKHSIITSLLNLMVALSFAQNSSRALYQKLQVCKPEGVPDSVLCGSYPVYENRRENSGRIINLNIIVIPALNTDSLRSPVFYIEGGPGIAGTNTAFFYADPANPYRQYHDVVLIDVRGTGGSNPLHCLSLQSKPGLKEQFGDMYPGQAVKNCFDSLSKRADLTQYTTTNVVNDLEEIRKWLGYEKINLFGLSYGARVALVYMKMFPSSVESCVLWSPTHTYGRMPLYHAKFAQNTLEQLFDSCKRDSACNTAFPGLKNEFNTLMQRTKSNPFLFHHTDTMGHSEQLVISWDAFTTRLRSLMYTPMELRQIPYIVHEAYLGNLDPFIALYPKGSDTSYFIAEGFYLCITCSEDVPFIHDDEIDSLTRGTFMGSYRVDQQKKACANWTRGEIPADFLDTIHSDIPTLIFSGSLDPVTPVSFATEIASHLPKSKVVIIPQMSHMFDGLSHEECFDNIAISFIDNPMDTKWNLDCIKDMQPGPYKVRGKD